MILILETKKATMMKKENQEKIQWAHLDGDDFTAVNLIAVESPSLFFLKITAFHHK